MQTTLAPQLQPPAPQSNLLLGPKFRAWQGRGLNRLLLLSLLQLQGPHTYTIHTTGMTWPSALNTVPTATCCFTCTSCCCVSVLLLQQPLMLCACFRVLLMLSSSSGMAAPQAGGMSSSPQKRRRLQQLR